jgi:hypothetical protein
MVESRQLIVVRRGEADLFRVLQERFGADPASAPVIWDRRMRDRRVIIRDDVTPERRLRSRRAAEPSTWMTHGFLITRRRPDRPSPSRPRSRPPIATGRAQALIESATRLGAEAAACRHSVPRGLRTDEDHVRLYARLLRKSGRQLSGECPLSRLRRGFREFRA